MKPFAYLLQKRSTSLSFYSFCKGISMQKVPAQVSSVEWSFACEYETSLGRFILSVVVFTLKIRERGNSLSTH